MKCQIFHTTMIHEVKKLGVEIGRNMIRLCEENKLFPKDGHLWNCSIVSNKLTTVNCTWARVKTVNDLTQDERKAVLGYLEYIKVTMTITFFNHTNDEKRR